MQVNLCDVDSCVFIIWIQCLSGRTDVEVSWVELNSKMMDPVMAQRNVHEQQMVSVT